MDFINWLFEEHALAGIALTWAVLYTLWVVITTPRP